MAAVLAAVLVAVVTTKWVVDGADTGANDATQRGGTNSGAETLDQPVVPAAPVEDITSTETGAESSEDIAGEFDTNLFDLTVTPSSGLVDGQQIQFSATPTPGDLADLNAQICAAGDYTTCTRIQSVTSVPPTDEVTASLIVPRRFSTPTGAIHDCVSNSPCELLVWLTPLQDAPATASLNFDPSAPVTPIQQIGLLPEGPFATTDSVIVVSDDVTEYDLLQCAVSEEVRCEALPRQTQPSESSPRLDRIATLHRTINTPAGSHDCILDGPCELRLVTPTSELVEPVLLEFDPESAPEPPPEVVVRPAVNLDDGQLIEVRVAAAGESPAVVSLCQTGTPLCLSLGDVATSRWNSERLLVEQSSNDGSASYFNLPRQFSDTTTDNPVPITVDCGGDECELRIQGARSSRNVPISFDPTSASLPVAEILLGEVISLFPGSVTTVRGRNFFVIDPENPPSIELLLCPSPESDTSTGSCGRLRNSPTIVRPDGTFTTQITLPTSDSRGQLVGVRGLCTPTCRIVVETDYEGHGDSAVRLEIEVQIAED